MCPVILSKAKELRTQKKLKKMKQNGTIELEGMEFHSFHGCLESERREGNLFTVDFRACLDLGKAAATDSLEDTLDYGRIYDIVAGQMQIPSDLIENVAGRIISAISDDGTPALLAILSRPAIPISPAILIPPVILSEAKDLSLKTSPVIPNKAKDPPENNIRHKCQRYHS